AVDVSDLGSLATIYGATSGATWAGGDSNYDGAVGVGDLGALATNYGQSLPGGGGGAAAAVPTAAFAAAVPEPCVSAFVTAALLHAPFHGGRGRLVRAHIRDGSRGRHRLLQHFCRRYDQVDRDLGRRSGGRQREQCPPKRCQHGGEQHQLDRDEFHS